MRVGVHIRDIEPTGGGGFTIQDDIYQSLLKLQGESQHQFFLIVYRNDQLSVHQLSDMQQIGVYQRSLSERGMGYLYRLRPGRHKFDPVPRMATDAIHEHQLEMIWFLDVHYISVDAPHIVTVWDLQHRLQPWFPEYSKERNWNAREKQFRRMLQRASRIIIGNETGKREIVNFYQVNPDLVNLLPHPTPAFALNAPAANDAILSKYNIPAGYLFYPAQFWAHKNHANLLHALHTLKTKHGTSPALVLVGSDKGNKSYIESLARELGIHEQVHILGFIPREDLIALYQNALALVYLTLFGPENLPPLEAFALGCPVIASRVAGAEEQFGDAALLVDGLNVEAVADAIQQVMNNPTLRQNLIRRGRERAAQWTADDFVRAVFAVLDEFALIRRTWR